MKKSISILLSFCLLLFLADGLASLIDNSLILWADAHFLSPISGMVTVAAVVVTFLVYLLMGLTPMIPKRYFLPLTLFNPLLLLAILPLSITHWERMVQIDWATSLLQILFGIAMLAWMHGGLRFPRPLLPPTLLNDRKFSWGNLAGFLAFNLLLLLPAVLLYLGWCGATAVDKTSRGFLALKKDSLIVRAREYARDDGKIIHLVPMMHIGETGFYQQVLKLIPTNSAILVEGVSDEKNLLGRKLSYKKMASNLGLSEQQEHFTPQQGKIRHADLDVEKFSKRSIGFLKLVTRFHADQITPQLIQQVMEESKDPELMKELWADLLTRRNEHLLSEIEDELKETEVIVVPWGAAHMPSLEEEILKMGFRKRREREYPIFHYRTLLQRPPTPAEPKTTN